ncbi:unnamed protein product [Penicillium salamii]|nr:unnamed protein product [Penicillium salamii]
MPIFTLSMVGNMQTSDAGPDETMRLAVERFRAKMESSNRRFLQDRIDEIEAMGLATEEEKLDKMSLYWPGLGKKMGRWNDIVPPGPVQQNRETSNVTRLEDVNSTFHQYMDGIIPSTLVTEEWREMYLEVIQSVCNKAAIQDNEDKDEDFQVPKCVELGNFIKYANGVQDPDFRCSGICPFHPIFSFIGVKSYAFPDHPAVLALPTPNISKSREILKDYLEDYILDEDFIQGIVDEDLEVKVGFETGLGCRHEHDEWRSAYLYCRSDDEAAITLKEWAWRVVVFHADGENPATLYGRQPRFDSIPEFLDWYSSWLDYVDMDEVRRAVLGLEGDEDGHESEE